MRLLVVEDSTELAEALADGLRGLGFAVDVAGTFAEGDYKATITEYDVIVLDLNLPDGDGVELCRQLREGGSRAAILMLTARDRVADRVRGLDSGADDYVVKPFALEELTARIRALLRRAAEQRRPRIKLGNLEVCPATFTAAWAGEPLRLTAREFAVLEYLALRSPEVVSADELLEHVCDEYANPFSNTIRVHVANLRRKLGEAAGDRLVIDTLVGRGYRLWAQDQSR
ncbi:MAG: response regulator transcription factor [Bacillota bacterium]|nr:response regulator transcription factor [Bacillota bacterium]